MQLVCVVKIQIKNPHDIYEPYKDELEGWNAIALKGNLKDIR